MNQEPSLQETIKSEVKRVKNSLYVEELTSFFLACIFGINLAGVLAGSHFFIVNLVLMWWVGKTFRKTVRKQEMFHLTLGSLKELEAKLNDN